MGAVWGWRRGADWAGGHDPQPDAASLLLTGTEKVRHAHRGG